MLKRERILCCSFRHSRLEWIALSWKEILFFLGKELSSLEVEFEVCQSKARDKRPMRQTRRINKMNK